MSVSYRIKNMLKLRGMTDKDLAKATGLSLSAVRYAINYEHRTGAFIYFIRQLASALGCTPGWLLQDKEWIDNK